MKGIGLEKAFMAWGSWLIRNLGLPEKDFPFELSNEDRHWEPKLTDSFSKRFRLDEQDKRGKGGKANFPILMKRTKCVVKQVLSYYRLAPRDVVGRFFEMVSRQVRLRRR